MRHAKPLIIVVVCLIAAYTPICFGHTKPAISTNSPSTKNKVVKSVYMPEPDKPYETLLPHSIVQPSPEPQSSRLTSAIQTRGIDVSHYQGRIQWNAVADDPQVAFCYIKATESSTYVDDCYQTNIREARRHGVKAGAYHFFSPSTSPYDQLANMTAVVKKQDQDLIPLIDVEKIGRRTNPATFVQRLKVFLNGVEKHYGVRPLIYTGQNFFNKYLAGRLHGYRFMIAKYRDDPPEINDPHVEVLMWQYTDCGSINGIRGNCDQSVFINNYDLKEILYNK